MGQAKLRGSYLERKAHATTITVQHFEAGDKVDAISTAGEAFDEYRLGPISASVFTLQAGQKVCPMIQSSKMGSGKLDLFLTALRAMAGPVIFVNVINQPLAVHLLSRGFDVKEVGEDGVLRERRAPGPVRPRRSAGIAMDVMAAAALATLPQHRPQRDR